MLKVFGGAFIGIGITLMIAGRYLVCAAKEN